MQAYDELLKPVESTTCCKNAGLWHLCVGFAFSKWCKQISPWGVLGHTLDFEVSSHIFNALSQSTKK